MSVIVNGNELDMNSAPLYRKYAPVTAVKLTGKVTFHHSWGDQTMYPGDFQITDPATQATWGCEAETFRLTYEELPDKPGFFCKVARVRAIKMRAPFIVSAIDEQSKPETGMEGDYLVETIRLDGRHDRYLIPGEDFDRMYQVVEE